MRQNINPETLYLQLRNLVATMPNFMEGAWATDEGRVWLGRAAALVEASGDVADIATFNVAHNNLGTTLHAHNVQAITSVVYRTLARAELAAPAALQGQFIAAGDTMTAFATVAKVFERAKQDLLLVDAYADHTVITDFAVTAPQNVSIRILTVDKQTRAAVLKPAGERWNSRPGETRRMAVRLVPSNELHDRLIVVDGSEAWAPGQSFNGMAKSASTSILRADDELARQKIAHFSQLWASATPLV